MKIQQFLKENPSTRRSFGSLILLGATLLLAVGVLIASLAMAWFTLNKSVKINGMEISVKTKSTVIISQSPEELKNADGITDEMFHLIIEPTDTMFEAATHDDAYTSKLKYVVNKTDVAWDDGITVTDVQYEEAEENLHYKDIVIYMASFKSVVSGASIRLTLSGSADYPTNAFRAGSIDFYAFDGDTPRFLSTLNLAGVDTADLTKGKTSIVLSDFSSASGEDNLIPDNATGDYVKILMRCYYDGALLDESGNAYFRSANLTDVDTQKLLTKFHVDISVTGDVEKKDE